MRKVLFVDDNPITSFIGRLILEDIGFSVISVSGGSEALAVIQRQPLDLVFLDLMMPDMSGLEVLCYIRGKKE